MEGTEKAELEPRWGLYHVSFAMPDTALEVVGLLFMSLKLQEGFHYSSLNGSKPEP